MAQWYFQKKQKYIFNKYKDKSHGKGRLIVPNGDVFIGYWENDKARGKGKYFHIDGPVYEGDWENDK